VKILFAHCFYRIPGGEDRHVRDQVDLVSAAHDVELISEENSTLAETPATAARMLYSLSKRQEVQATIDRFRPDVVHIHNMYPAFGPAVVLAARERAVPVVMTVHNFRLRCPNGLMFTEGATCRRCESGIYINAVVHRCFPKRKQAGAYAAVLWGHRFLMRLETQIARFIVPSEFVRRRLVEWGISEDRVSMIRHFVRPVRKAGADTAIGSHGVFLGRLSSEKGVDVLLRALHRAGDPPFLVVGEGSQRRALEDLASTLPLANTRFLGWRSPDEAGELLASARYVAIPSVWDETANLAALEGLTAARPLLVSDRGALPELVSGGAGLRCRAGDEVDMSEKIMMLMQDDELCRQASDKAAQFASRWLEPSRHLGALESLYQSVSA
jgi:glycosyltransferase involved in cell wall biosynthesis